MRNKRNVVLTLMSIMMLTGVASAAMAPFDLTNSNNPELNGIIIRVTPGESNLSVQLINNPVTNAALGIDQFFYNLTGQEIKKGANVAPYRITSVIDPNGIWPDNKLNFNGTQADGFGNFLSHRSKTSPAGTGGIYDPIIFNLATPFSTIMTNSQHGRVAVHIRFNGCSAWVSDATTNTGTPDTDPDGSTTSGCTKPPNNNIPEFPTIALPIAAVIGLVFFFQHKKKKEE